MSITEVKLAVDTMSVAELQREVDKHYSRSEAILTEAKTRGGLSEDESKQVGEALQMCDSLEAVLSRKQSDEQNAARVRAQMEQRRTPANPMIHADPARTEGKAADRRKGEQKSIGQQFIDNPSFQAFYPAGVKQSEHAIRHVALELPDYAMREHKAVLQGGDAVSGGGFVANDRIPAVVDIRQRMLTFLDLITRITTSSDTIEWVKEDTFTNNAAAVAEATATTGTSGTKPESVLAYSVVTSPVQTVAHWIPITTRMLADYPGIKGLIDARLMVGLDLALETAILSGNGSAPNLQGLVGTSGVLTRALGSDSVMDAIFKLMTMVQVTGLAIPNATVMHPSDFQDIRLARENAATGTLGQYLYGPPSTAGPMTLWGRPLVESIGLAEGTALTGDFSAQSMVLWDREQATVRTGTIDDYFIRNMLVLLAELRVAFTVFRASAIGKVTGV